MLLLWFAILYGLPTEKAMAPHSSTLAWKTPWVEEPGRLQWGHEESDTTERLDFHFSLSCVGKGNGNPLQCSCLENPRDGGAWWAAVYGVAQSQTRQKWLSSSSSSMGFPGGSVVKNCLPMQETQEIQFWSLGGEDSPGEVNGNPLQYSCLGNPMDRGAWRATIYGVTKSRTRLSMHAHTHTHTHTHICTHTHTILYSPRILNSF